MKLSVIIAVYNEAATARTLLANVLKQPLPRLEKEIVIVESNSTDGSRPKFGVAIHVGVDFSISSQGDTLLIGHSSARPDT